MIFPSSKLCWVSFSAVMTLVKQHNPEVKKSIKKDKEISDSWCYQSNGINI